MKKADSLSDVVVATDDGRIADLFGTMSGTYVLLPNRPSGTDRCSLKPTTRFKCRRLRCGSRHQGDEPFIEPEQIDELCAAMLRGRIVYCHISANSRR
ncbi:MAG: hypothetical protein IPP33_19295 [Flavobacteriales bacterium]|nr:hypothetical protein [Flavobacteriales bacterium]